MERRLVIIGGWNDIYKKAKALDFDITIVQRKQDVKSEDIGIIDQLVTAPLSDKSVPEIIEALHKHRPFDAVVSFQELGILNAGLIVDRLGIHGNPLRPVLLTRDKCMMRRHMQAARIPSIPFIEAADSRSIADFGGKFGWPIILKPANGVGSIQVHKIHGPNEVEAKYEQILTDPVFHEVALPDFPDAKLIAEVFVTGKEVSVEAMSWAGRHTVIGITDKITIGEDNFVEVGHTMPSTVPEPMRTQITKMVVCFLESIGHSFGPSHTEIVISEDGPVIIESHTRSGGDRIFDMVEYVHGVDMIGETLKGFAGVIESLPKKTNGGAAIRFLQTMEGTVKSIQGIDEASKLEGVISVDIGLKPGATLKESSHSAERPGYVLAVGETGMDAARVAETALNSIEIEVAKHV